MMLELMEETAHMLRGMCMDPRIPKDTKEALWSRVSRLDAATEAAPSNFSGLQEVHAVQWYSDGGRTRCLEVFEDIQPARVFADHLPVGSSAWITSLALRGAAYAQAFATGGVPPRACGCREGTCESKPHGCRMAAEVASRDPAAM
jgi:hypothetical protein